MSRNIAIVAHFDADNALEPCFLELLHCLLAVLDRVIVVTTSDIDQNQLSALPNLEVIKRPNFGYDFYSYRVGLQRVYAAENLDAVVLANSSFVVVDPDRFTATLRRMLELAASYQIVGATESYQKSWHLQSYLLLLRRDVLLSEWFRAFVHTIQPLNTKREVIQRYELGLSKGIVKNEVSATKVFAPSRADLCKSFLRWSKWSLREHGVKEWLKGCSSRAARLNPTHFLASEIARELGYVKIEVLRDNPFLLETKFVGQIAGEKRHREILEMMERLKPHYTRGAGNLATFSEESTHIPRFRRVQWGEPGVDGVNIAVVLHLYYAELLEEIVASLKNIVMPFDLFVTTPFEGDIARIIEQGSDVARSVSVLISENRGRDIGPFVALYRSGALDRYSAVLKCHSKKSSYSDQGDLWRRTIYRNVTGDSLTVQRTIGLLASSEVGIVGPHSYYLTDAAFWGGNRKTMRRLLRAMDLVEEDEELELGFFAGSMFWFNPRALRPLAAIPEKELSFEPETGRQDGTLAHAFERLFCLIARKTEFRTTSVRLNGAEIHATDTRDHCVPVLASRAPRQAAGPTGL